MLEKAAWVDRLLRNARCCGQRKVGMGAHTAWLEKKRRYQVKYFSSSLLQTHLTAATFTINQIVSESTQSTQETVGHQTSTHVKMSSLTYTNYEGVGQALSDKTHYSMAVRVPTNPPTIKTSGQGGWDSTTGEFPPNPHTLEGMRAQFDQAFANVELALKAAGSKGWSDVYLARMFYVLDGERDSEPWKTTVEDMLQAGGETMRKWCPNHRPLLTAVEVRALAAANMRVEVEVEALLQE